MSLLKIYLILVLITRSLNRSNSSSTVLGPTKIDLDQHTECISNFIKQYINANLNIIVNLNKIHQPYLNMFQTKPYYYIQKQSSFLRLLHILNETQITPNSFSFLFPSIDNLKLFLKEIKQSQIFYILAKYLVVVNSGVISLKVAELLFSFNLYYSVVIVVAYKQSALFYALYSRGEQSKLKQVGICDQIDGDIIEEIGKYSQLYPRNTTLYAIWSQHIPFIIYEKNISLTGIKVDALKSFNHSSPVKLVYRPYDTTWENELYANYTFHAVQKAFESDYADCYTGSGDINIGMYFDVGPIIIYNEIYFFVPRLLRSSFLDIILSLMRFERWVITFVSFILWVIIFTNISKFTIDRKKFASYLRNLMVFYNFVLGYSYNINSPKSFVARILIICYLVMVLQITILIQGEMVSIITGSQYTDPITNLDELLDSRLPIKIADAVLKAFPNQDEPSVVRLRNLYISKNIDMFILENESLRDKNFAAVSDIGFLIMHPQALETHNIFYLMGIHQIFAMPRNHYLKKHFFERLERIVESGIFDKYIKLYTFRYSLAGDQHLNKRDFQLTFNMLSGVFIILLVGNCLALFTFLGEIVILKFQIRRNK